MVANMVYIIMTPMKDVKADPTNNNSTVDANHSANPRPRSETILPFFLHKCKKIKG